ncbi:helix-turn-helix transcriptional regulator [Amycolatopsis sp. Hca4]|uniref:ArsR/SmtB family transcription factor n=1 Tax=Amycolatopsis sp. Hca4 TaxID=2742131 RepID=UPI0015923A0C|nr:winged helix-turn-helix domain-containing protein [Amycolatopsis sp. Hca4]QKV74111.1 winged helix-turn-helix transcriptional regulator [Amycolatopsis sp. Hca4]
MGFRFHFTVEDLARTRVDDRPYAMMELLAALRQLQSRAQPVRFGAWRSEVTARLPAQARMIVDLAPPSGSIPGFLFPPSAGEAHQLLDEARAISSREIRTALLCAAESRSVPGWVHRLVDDRQLRRQLFDTFALVYEQALAPYWPHVRTTVAIDRVLKGRDLLDGGADRVLSGLNPRYIRWNPPVLEVKTPIPLYTDIHLDGRGLLLVPSVFGAETHPLAISSPESQPLLTYPAQSGDGDAYPLLIQTDSPIAAGLTFARLAALLGRTRATVLCTIAEHPGCTTTELARRAGIAPASASEHATILREAGLTTTIRHRNLALHTLTGSGTSLLNPDTASATPSGFSREFLHETPTHAGLDNPASRT